jgi:hypothetical protein
MEDIPHIMDDDSVKLLEGKCLKDGVTTNTTTLMTPDGRNFVFRSESDSF